jgi:hypothetical protein
MSVWWAEVYRSVGGNSELVERDEGELKQEVENDRRVACGAEQVMHCG